MTREPIPTERSADTLRTDISQTRRRMDETLDRLAERLQPRHILNDLLDFWQVRRSRHGNGHHLGQALQDNARKVGDALMAQIRENPMPTFLIGAGIAWLIASRREPYPLPSIEVMPQPEVEEVFEESEASVGAVTEPVGRAAGTVRRKASEMQEKLRSGGQHLKERVVEKGERIRARAQDVGRHVQDKVRQGYEHTQDRVRESYQQAHERFQEAAESHPLATGAAFLGIGLLAGFLLPKTRREDEWLGDTAATVRHRVKEAGRGLVERGTHVAQAAAKAAKREAEEQGLTPQHLKEGVKAVAQEAKEAAARTAEAEGISPESLKQRAQGATENMGSSNAPVV